MYIALINNLNVSSVDISRDSFLISTFILLALLLFLLGYQSRTRLGFHWRKVVGIPLSLKKADYKPSVRILFIDDKDVPNARTLKDDGWNVQTLRDAEVAHQKIKDANIIFVDWKDVGKRISSDTQGIALAENIKRTYGHKKFVILYSVQEHQKPTGVIADEWLNKGSQFSDYVKTIERAAFVLLS